jgi:exonuclease VII large subunit
MEERSALKLALLCSLAGLVLLYFSSAWLERSSLPTKASDVTIDLAGFGIKVCGNLSSFRTMRGHVFFGLQDGTGNVGVVVFNTTAAKINASGTGIYSLSVGRSACVIGSVEEYPPGEGSIEVVAKKVVL